MGQLKKEGYQIEAVQNRGYRLASNRTSQHCASSFPYRGQHHGLDGMHPVLRLPEHQRLPGMFRDES